jgi:hypothetical protein
MSKLTPVVAGMAIAVTLVSPSWFGSMPAVAFAQQEIRLSLPDHARVRRLAIAEFVAPAGDADLAVAAKTVADVLWNDIEFEYEFDLVTREAAAQVPRVASIDALPLDHWAALGADSVVFGVLHRTRDGFTIDLHLVGARGNDLKKLQFGAIYTGCTLTNPRRCAHAVSDDLHQKLSSI